jgi:hypothetical protein
MGDDIDFMDFNHTAKVGCASHSRSDSGKLDTLKEWVDNYREACVQFMNESKDDPLREGEELRQFTRATVCDLFLEKIEEIRSPEKD